MHSPPNKQANKPNSQPINWRKQTTFATNLSNQSIILISLISLHLSSPVAPSASWRLVMSSVMAVINSKLDRRGGRWRLRRPMSVSTVKSGGLLWWRGRLSGKRACKPLWFTLQIPFCARISFGHKVKTQKI